MSEPATATATLKALGDPALEGEITFVFPNFYQRIAIGRRMFELVNLGRNPKAPEVNVDQLDADSRYWAEAVATLEYVIHTAPQGWYQDRAGQAELVPGALLDTHTDAVVQAYTAYLAERTRFRDASRGATRGDQTAPTQQVDGDGGAQS